jgi:hypothetical protein
MTNDDILGAISAGDSPKTARFIGAENLTKPNIISAILNAREERSKAAATTWDAGALSCCYLLWLRSVVIAISAFKRPAINHIIRGISGHEAS